MIKFEKIPADILTRLMAAGETLSRDSNIVFAYLFGGLAGGAVRPLSDVDIAVYLDSTENLASYKMDLIDRLSVSLGTAEIDLVTLNTAPVSLAGRILQKRKILADKEPFLRHRYESLVLREYFDFKVKEDYILTRRYQRGG